MGSISIFKYFRPVGSSSSSTTLTFLDLDGPLSERVSAKAIKLANAEVKHSQVCFQRQLIYNIHDIAGVIKAISKTSTE